MKLSLTQLLLNLMSLKKLLARVVRLFLRFYQGLGKYAMLVAGLLFRKVRLFDFHKWNSVTLFARILRQAQDERLWDACEKKTTRARGERSKAKSNPYERNTVSIQSGFTIIESVLTMVIIASSLTVIFALQTNVMKSVFGTHYIIEHIIGIRNFVVKNDQEEYYKQGKVLEKKFEDRDYSVTYEPKPAKQFPALSSYKNITVEKMKISSKSVFLNHDEFVFFRFNPEGKS